MRTLQVVVCAVAVAVAVAWLGAGKAHARNTITSEGGCNQEFKDKASRKACNVCVKDGGRWKKSIKKKGWGCERGGDASDSGGDACLPENGCTPTKTIAEHERGDAWPKPLASMPEQQKHYVTIQPGTFRIGTPKKSENEYRKPSQLDSNVTITRAFMMKTTEVTDGEFFFVMKRMPKRYKAGCLDCPANFMSFADMIEYLNKLSKLEKLETCYTATATKVTWKGLDCEGYRLPTDAEWEYAGRGGSTEPTYGPMDEIAWHSDNSTLDGHYSRHPVRQKKPNKYGLYDMMGNMSEMTWDEYKERAFENDSTDPVTGGLEVTDFDRVRTARGPGFTDSPDYATIASRYEGPASGSDWIGFRPVRTVKK